MKKVLIRLCVVLFVVGIIFVNEVQINAANTTNLGGGLNSNLITPTPTEDGKLENSIATVVQTVIIVVRAFAVIGVAIMGAKYMLADSQGKSKIKDNLIWIVLGVLLVTSSTVIVEKVAKAGKEALPI